MTLEHSNVKLVGYHMGLKPADEGLLTAGSVVVS